MRRRTLFSTPATSTAGFGGCLGAPPTPRSSTGSTSLPTDPPAVSVQCRGPPVTAERSVPDEPGYGDDLEYFPENGTVRFVSLRSDDESQYGEWSLDEWSLDEWAGIECTRVGVGRVRERPPNDSGPTRSAPASVHHPRATPTTAS